MSDYKEIWEQITAFLVKYISIPALIAIFIKIAIQVKKRQATIMGALTSLFVGLMMAYLTKGIVYEYFTHDGVRTIVISFIAIMADKIAEYLIFKANVDKFFDLVGKTITDWFKAKFGSK